MAMEKKDGYAQAMKYKVGRGGNTRMGGGVNGKKNLGEVHGKKKGSQIPCRSGQKKTSAAW